jgi:hypothetical protein
LNEAESARGPAQRGVFSAVGGLRLVVPLRSSVRPPKPRDGHALGIAPAVGDPVPPVRPSPTLRWFFLAILSAFVAGVVLGLVTPRVAAAFRGAEREPSTDPYVVRIVETYGLDAEQARQLELIQRHRDRERTAIFEEERQRLPEPIRQRIDARLDKLAERTERRIEHVFTADQLDLWRRDMRPVELEPAASDDR